MRIQCGLGEIFHTCLYYSLFSEILQILTRLTNQPIMISFTECIEKSGGTIAMECVYKVVRLVDGKRISARVAAGDLYSLPYSPWKRTIAPAHAPLFCFSSIDGARNWVEADRDRAAWSELELWEAETMGTYPAPLRISAYGVAEYIKRFWSSSEKCPGIDTPAQALLCPEITLTCNITPSHWIIS